MKVYISTPVTSRPEKTLFEQRIAAQVRCLELVKKWELQISPEDDLTSFCECTAPIMNNAWAMGRCVEELLSSDAILFDEDGGADNSRGCRLELMAACIYNLQCFFIRNGKIQQSDFIKIQNNENKNF